MGEINGQKRTESTGIEGSTVGVMGIYTLLTLHKDSASNLKKQDHERKNE